MNRRGFLSSILALAAAPAIVRADSLMRIVPLDTFVLAGEYELNAVNAALKGEAALIATIRKVWEAGGEPDIIRCSPQFARELSGAEVRFAEVGSRPIIEPVPLYISDYGCAKIIVERELPHDFIVESPGGYPQAILDARILARAA